jgi:glycosyltransferase involved in cell wall biosynthesis
MAEPYVAVCACTYRRPEGLGALLGGLAAQRFAAVPRRRFDVVIVDNEGSTEAAAICAKAGLMRGWRCATSRSRAAAFRTRAIARGPGSATATSSAGQSITCLDHVARNAEFFAMIDDDEVPELEQLLCCAQARAGADVVRGAVVPVFSDARPSARS